MGKRSLALVCVVAANLSSACTALGPMPATTAVTPIPAPRPGLEAQVAVLPGYFLSGGVTDSSKGAGLPGLAGLFDLGDLIGLPGLAVGGRYVGEESSGPYPEAMLAYRRMLGSAKRFAGAVVGYGTHASGDDDGASYSATRLGTEVALDARLTPINRWFELHSVVRASATFVSADGTYCLDDNGQFGEDCADPPERLTDTSVSGLYPAAYLGLAADFFRHRSGVLHGARFELGVAAGTRPRAEFADQVSAGGYFSLGASFTVALGAPGR